MEEGMGDLIKQLQIWKAKHLLTTNTQKWRWSPWCLLPHWSLRSLHPPQFILSLRLRPNQILFSHTSPLCQQNQFQRSNDSLSPNLWAEPWLTSHFYHLAGQLREIEDGCFQLHCNTMGDQLLEAGFEAKMISWFGWICAVEKLMPNIDYNLPIEEIPLLVAQLTRF